MRSLETLRLGVGAAPPTRTSPARWRTAAPSRLLGPRVARDLEVSRPPKLEPHHRMARRPVPAVVGLQPCEQLPAAREQLLQRVEEQALAEASRTRQEVVLSPPPPAARRSPSCPRSSSSRSRTFAQGLDADRQNLAGHSRLLPYPVGGWLPTPTAPTDSGELHKCCVGAQRGTVVREAADADRDADEGRRGSMGIPAASPGSARARGPGLTGRVPRRRPRAFFRPWPSPMLGILQRPEPDRTRAGRSALLPTNFPSMDAPASRAYPDRRGRRS